MIDRASTFANPEIVEFLRRNTVPVAIDQAYQRRQTDTEGDFYRKIAGQGPRNDFRNGTTQGLYMAAPDGTFLGYTNNRDPQRVMKLLQDGLQKFRPTPTAEISAMTTDPRFNPKPPQGGLVIRVQAKVLGGYAEPTNEFEEAFQTSLSRDNLWVSKPEHKALIAGSFPRQLAERIARFHLVDNTRGEPPMWREDEIRESHFEIKGTQIDGHVELKTSTGDRSFSVDLIGEFKTANGKITGLNMVAKGTFSGEGRYTRGAPNQPFPLGISFTLADGTDFADAIPPQGSRGWIRGYLD